MSLLSSLESAGTKDQSLQNRAQNEGLAFADEAGADSISQIHVLLLADYFLPHAGGSREYYFNIYQELVALGGTRVTILTKKVRGWEEFDKKANERRFRIIRRFKPLPDLKLKELPKGLLPFLHTLWHIVRNPPEIIHTGDLYPQGLIAYCMKKFLGIPYVAYCHGEEITQMDRYRYQPLMRDLIYRSADAVVANSNFACGLLSRIGVSSERIHKINPGVDVQRFKPAAKSSALSRKYNLEGKLVVLTVARLIPRKGHFSALQGFARVCEEFPKAHYLIAGTGPEEQRIRKQVEELQLQDRVTFTGFVPAEQLPELYNLCEIMLLANRQEAGGDVEGFGMVFLEANAVGKPVIGGKSGGAIEAIEHGVTGFLVNPDDPEEIAEILHRLLADSCLRERIGLAGMNRATKEFGWKSRAELLNKINASLLQKPTISRD